MSYSFVSIYGNLYLYRFLKTQTDNNFAVKNNVKKSRNRNVIPAKVGMVNAIALVGIYIVYIVIYSVPNGNMINFDTGTRSYILNVFNDLFPCFIAPGLLIFNAPTIRQTFQQIYGETSDMFWRKNFLKLNSNSVSGFISSFLSREHSSDLSPSPNTPCPNQDVHS